MKANDNQLFIIIQARMTSTRLSGKVMLPLCGKTVLEIMLDRLSRFRKKIIIATTNDGTEQPIVDLCERLSINYYRGDTDNVLSRYYEAAIYYKVKEEDSIVRLTSDCPVIDQNILEKMLVFYEHNKYDYVSNTVSRTYPRGLDVEIFSFKALKKAYNNAITKFETEHVTTYIHTTHKEEFQIGSYTDKKDNSKYRLTLDEEDDYLAIKELYSRLSCRTNFTYTELLEILYNNAYIYELNAGIEQKKR